MLISVFLIAFAMSMDAFSLSLILGMNSVKFSKLIVASAVGIFHVIMPIFGFLVGTVVINKLFFSIEIITSIILFFIAMEMILSSFEKKDSYFLVNIKGLLIFALTVSIDAFTIGTSIFLLNQHFIFILLNFFAFSFLATYIGIKIGDRISHKIGNYSTLLGGIILIFVAMLHLFI